MLLNFNIFAKCLSTNKFSRSLEKLLWDHSYDFNLENMVRIPVDELPLTTQLCPERPPSVAATLLIGHH